MFAIVFMMIVVIAGVVWVFHEMDKKEENAQREYRVLKQRLESTPLDQDLHKRILSLSRDHNDLAQESYPLALGILENNPNSLVAKQFALKAGRTSHASGRADKKPTIYDEQAIQNDIMIRCNNAAPQLAEV